MRIRCSRPELLPELRDFLARGEWTSEEAGPGAIELCPPPAIGRSARTDLRFSLASWLVEHPSATVEIGGR